MTIADWIRSMTDVELAQFFTSVLSERDRATSQKLSEQGIANTLIEIPSLSVSRHLEFLQQPAETLFKEET